MISRTLLAILLITPIIFWSDVLGNAARLKQYATKDFIRVQIIVKEDVGTVSDCLRILRTINRE